jgi:hypothetical protein
LGFLVGILKINLAVSLLEAVYASIDIRHLHVGIVYFGSWLKFADIHQLHQECFFVFGKFLMLPTACAFLG